MEKTKTYMIDTQYPVVPCRRLTRYLTPASDCPACEYYVARRLAVKASSKYKAQYDIQCGFPRLVETHGMDIDGKSSLTVSCHKGVPAMIISMDDCEKCEFHKGFTTHTDRNLGVVVKCDRPSNVREIMYAKTVEEGGN